MLDPLERLDEIRLAANKVTIFGRAVDKDCYDVGGASLRALYKLIFANVNPLEGDK